MYLEAAFSRVNRRLSTLPSTAHFAQHYYVLRNAMEAEGRFTSAS
jgi:hypothetical protein